MSLYNPLTGLDIWAREEKAVADLDGLRITIDAPVTHRDRAPHFHVYLKGTRVATFPINGDVEPKPPKELNRSQIRLIAAFRADKQSELMDRWRRLSAGEHVEYILYP